MLLDVVEHVFRYLLNVQRICEIRISKVYLSIHAYSKSFLYITLSTFFISLLSTYRPFSIIFFITLPEPPLVLWLSEGVLKQSIQKIVEMWIDRE